MRRVMPFRPSVNDELTLNGKTCLLPPHLPFPCQEVGRGACS